MRKIAFSGKRSSRQAFSARAERRSRPKGFSIITRAPWWSPAEATPEMTLSKALGGIAR